VDNAAESKVRSISAGRDHCVVVLFNRAAWGWGAAPPLGGRPDSVLGPTLLRPAPPCEINGIPQYHSALHFVTAGGDHTLGLTCDGRVFAWGANEYGQLGDGTTETAPRGGEQTWKTAPTNDAATGAVDR
jgi:alpha-tubulin suppressor-like RCC1 family protein